MSDQEQPLRAHGQCLCGGVRYEVRGPLREVLECHCRTCRRVTGGLWNATAARREHLTIHDGGSLAWFASSPGVRRGFCNVCGSSLFWDREDRPYLGITAGTLNEPTGLKLAARIFTEDTGDYYNFSPDVPNHPRHGNVAELPGE